MKRTGYVHSPVAENQEVIHEIAKEDIIEEANKFFSENRAERRDFILDLYRDTQARNRVVDFFGVICSSPEIIEVILENANSFDIPPALAFALAWEESRLNPYAVNNNNRDGSIDRGLFQLNNNSFPRLEIPAFFNPGINAQNGMSHLRHCLDVGGSEIAALAMYNAGTNRVNSSGTPRSTLDYISRIVENRRKIEDLFWEQETLFQKEQINEFSETIVEAKSERLHLVPLMPLVGLR
ncbi:MAG: lytic transglycosylase domain-containing protein [Treponema sp.]|nr:lytic transglycosylase domain-containing protein [Treponema sp.]